MVMLAFKVLAAFKTYHTTAELSNTTDAMFRIYAGFHTFKLCRPDPDEFACRIHVVFAFCLARYNEKFSSGEKDVV